MVFLLIKGKRIYIKELGLEDALKIKEWGIHKNTLLADYNLSKFTEVELRLWFYSKKSTIKRNYFAIYNQDQSMVGYLGMKDIKLLHKTSTLGIAIDPNHVNEGYGTESLRLFLPYYFSALRMRIMYLEVNEFNQRAIHVYEKIGFLKEGEYLAKFEVQRFAPDDPYFQASADAFIIKDHIIYSRIHVMKLTKDRFQVLEENYVDKNGNAEG